MTSRLTRLLACLLLLPALAGAQTIYKWVDAQGRTQYTQTPPPGSAKAETAQVQEAGAGPERHRYCEIIRQAAREIAYYRQRGGTLEAANRELAGLETKYQVDIGEVALRELSAYVFNAGRGTEADSGMPTRVFNACLGGSFGKYAMGARKSVAAKAKAPGTSRSGTGWITHGKIATNHHVIDGARAIRIVMTTGREIEATLESADPANDVAILAVRGLLPDGIPLAEAEAGMGADVFTLGYPHTQIMGRNAKLATGIVSATTGMGDDPRFYQISVPVQAGNSGGPLLDKSGRAIALVTSKLSAERMLAVTGDLPQNVNYAIKVAHLRKLLGPTPPARVLPVGAAPLEQLAARITPSVVLVVATGE